MSNIDKVRKIKAATTSPRVADLARQLIKAMESPSVAKQEN